MRTFGVIFFLATLATAFFRPGAGSEAARPNATAQIQPLWSVNIAAKGYRDLRWHMRRDVQPFAVRPMTFVDDETLAISIVSQVGAHLSQSRSQPAEDYDLVAEFHNAENGSIRKTRTWAGPFPSPLLLPAPGGRYIVVDHGQIGLYRGDEQLRSAALIGGPNGIVMQAYPSCDHGELKLWISGEIYAALNTDSLAQRRISVLDGPRCGGSWIKDEGGLKQRLLPAGRELPPRFSGYELVAPDTLVCFGPSVISFYNLALAEVLGEKMPDRVFPGGFDPVAAPVGQVVGIEISHARHAFGFDRYWGQVIRYEFFDIARRKKIFTLPATAFGISKKNVDVEAAAISPDGHLFAVLVEGVVRVFRIPVDGAPDARPGFVP